MALRVPLPPICVPLAGATPVMRKPPHGNGSKPNETGPGATILKFGGAGVDPALATIASAAAPTDNAPMMRNPFIEYLSRPKFGGL